MFDKKVQSYAYRHNRILRQYRRASLYLIWVAVLNLAAIALTAMTLFNDESGAGFGYGALFNHVGLALIAINANFEPSVGMYLLYAVLLSIPLTVLFIFLGAKAYHGSKAALFTGVALYAVDTVLLVLVFFSYLVEDGILAIIVHVAVMSMLFLACYKRSELIDLRQRHLGEYTKRDIKGPQIPTTMTFNTTKTRRAKRQTSADKWERESEPSPE